MKKAMKVLGLLLLLIAVLAGGGTAYLTMALPDVGEAPDLSVEITPQRVERGKYLANHVSLCMDCHGTREWDKFSAPMLPGTAGKGGEHFTREFGFPGDIVSPNITPYAIKDWTDGELYRAITSGVSRDGRALFPIMPYPHFGEMDQEDIYSIIAYIRSLDPVPSEKEETELDFPMNLIVRTIPKAPAHKTMPDKSDLLAYGAYMSNAAGCVDCHTKQEKGEFVGELFAGGFEFRIGYGRVVRSSNITPDPETGIGTMSEADFLARFRAYGEGYIPGPVKNTDFQTVMPWTMYAGMTDDDLKAIYAYLKSQPAVSNKVVKFQLEE